MARVQKKIGVTPVDESAPPVEEVVRLSPEVDATVPAKLTPAAPYHRLPSDEFPEIRLEVPGGDAGEVRRTHEPDMDDLIHEEIAPIHYEETVWGETSAPRHLPWGWFALMGVVFVAAVVWSLGNAISGGDQAAEEKQRLATNLAQEEEVKETLAASLDRMKDTARRYCEAETPTQLAALVRDAERVRPLMERYYATTPYQRLGFVKHLRFRDPALPSYRPLWIVSMKVGDGSTKHLLVEQRADGNYGVDWETAVVYQPMPWDRYVSERPRERALDFRVKVTEDHLFSHEFADANQWACFRLTAPDSTETLWGYLPDGSPAAEKIRSLILAARGRPAPMILRLNIPNHSQAPRGVLIEELVSPRWILLERTRESGTPATLAPR